MLFDFTTKQALAFINTGTAPLSNAIDGNYAIVANNGANSVSVIDVSKKQVINTVEFPGAVGGVTLNGLTGYVVVNAGTSTGYVQSFTITPSSNGFPVPAGNPNSDSTVQTIRAINGNCPVATQAMIDEFGTLTGQDYLDAARDLGPGLKLVQFSLEKLDLLLHKELESALYSSKEGTIPFVIAGYDNLDEGVNGPYNGYSIDSYYQMFGVTHDWKGAKWLATIGASESYMKVRPQPVKASYNTVWAALGGAGQSSRWHYGLDTIFGYSFIDGTRHIDFIDEKATTDHGAWNISFDGKLGYDFTNRVLDAMIYDDVSYIYGQENSYSETNSPAANLHVKNETISQIRNMLGLSFSSKQTKAFKIFADASWVYEHYFNNNTYQAAFVGTDVYGTYSQTEPSQNYARIHTGFKGEYKNFEWKLAYTGLFAKRFSENSASVKFGYKF